MLLEGTDKIVSLWARGKTGFGAGLGWYFFGYSFYGGADTYAGIYVTRHTSEGRRLSRYPIYRPTNPQTVTQQTNRARLTSAVSAWQALTSPQKQSYNETARGRRLSGYNYFLHLYLSNQL